MHPVLTRGLRFALAVSVAMVVPGLRVESQSKPANTAGKGIHYSATAVNMEAPVGGAATPVDIYIERWSTEAEWNQLMNTMLEAGPGKLLDVVQKMPRLGAIRTPGSVGFDLRVARRTPGPDNGERITILTDRPIAFWELRSGSRTTDYPFTVIELRILSNGQGEGRMTVGTKITADKEDRTIVLENYSVQPVMLKNVRREK